jgi:hypothetical protein
MEWTKWTNSKEGKNNFIVNKVMETIFWEAKEIIFIDYLEKG